MVKEPTTTTAAKSKRQKRVDVEIGYDDGDTGKVVRADAATLQFTFNETDEVRTIDLTKIPEASRLCAFVFGIRQKLQNTYASAAKEGIVAGIEQFDSVLELLMAGNWVQEGEKTGPRLTVILEAVIAAKANAGVEMTEKAVATLREKLKDKDFRDGVKANEFVEVEMKRIERERAEAREDAAREKAEGSEEAEAGLAAI